MHVRYATEADAPALARINIASFRHHGFWSNVFGGVADEAVYPLKRQRALDKMAHRYTHVLAAVDDETGEVVGYGRWLIPGFSNPSSNRGQDHNQDHHNHDQGNNQDNHNEHTKEDPTQMVLPEGARREVYDAFFALLQAKAKIYLREDDIVLELLATLPSAQGKGVGKALLHWGMQVADSRRQRIYLEATTDGFPLYRKMGWETLAEAEIDYREYGGEGVQVLTLMSRGPVVTGTE